MRATSTWRPWVSGLVGHFVQTWPDSELLFSQCSAYCSDLNWRCNRYHLFWQGYDPFGVDVPLNFDNTHTDFSNSRKCEAVDWPLGAVQGVVDSVEPHLSDHLRIEYRQPALTETGQFSMGRSSRKRTSRLQLTYDNPEGGLFLQGIYSAFIMCKTASYWQ